MHFDRRALGVALALMGCGGGPASEPRTPTPLHEHSGRHAGHHHGEGMVHDFSDVERFEQMFDAPGRAEWQRPVEVTMLLDVSSGQTVADIGAGTGYFEPLLAIAVGSTGRVIALDSEPAMVAHLEERAAREGLVNVEARLTTMDTPALEPSSVDRILIVDTWHHLPDRAAYAGRLREALRAQGSVLVVDFTMEAPHGPPPAMRLPPEVVIEELRAGGLSAELVTTEGLPHQYVIRAMRAE